MHDDLIDKVKLLVEIVKSNRLKSLSVQSEGLSCQIESLDEHKTIISQSESIKQNSALSSDELVPVEDNATYIKAPLVGTFYRSPSPNADSFVEIGDIVDPRQTLCIIEAMKVMNEIASECRGKIVEIYPENGQLVDYGHVLFKIIPILDEE